MSRPGKSEKRARREGRLTAALRENLKRRKAQARSRASAAGKEAPDERRADKAKEKA
jgi:hypothetical protein